MSLKPRRAFRPDCTCLEERTALSLSFSGLMESMFPFLGSDDKPAARRTATAHTAQAPATVHQGAHAAHAARAARAGRLAVQADPNGVDTPATSKPIRMTPTVILAGRLARNAALARQAASAAIASHNHNGVH